MGESRTRAETNSGTIVDQAVDAAPAPVRLRRVRHPGRIIWFAAVIAVLVAGAFIAGRLLADPVLADQQNANRTLVVTAAAEERVVAQEVSVVGVHTPGALVEIFASEETPASGSASAGAGGAGPGGAPAEPGTAAGGSAAGGTATETKPAPPLPAAEVSVVTRVTTEPGQTVTFGTLIAEVSGRPAFAVSPEFPRYRDLAVGSTGSDVRALQELLSARGYTGFRVNGEFAASTLAAADRFYRAAGYRLPLNADGLTVVPWRELITIPQSDSTLAEAATLGTVLGEEAPLITLRVGVDTVQGLAEPGHTDSFAPGTEVDLAIAGREPIRSTVTSLGEFTTDEATSRSGRRVTVAIPAELAGALDASSVIQIRTVNDAVATLAVPLVAIRHDAQGAHVLLPGTPAENMDASTPPPHIRVPVTVTAQAGGWAAITETEGVTVGTEIVVSS